MAAYAGEAEEGCPPAPEAPPSLACAWRLQKTLPTPNTAWQASHTKIEADSVAADPNHEQVWGRLRCPGLAAAPIFPRRLRRCAKRCASPLEIGADESCTRRSH